jgi:hypothetical protein
MTRYLPAPGGVTAGPDLLPGSPFTPLWSPLGCVPDSGAVVPDGVTVGPDLFPGNPGTPGLELPSPPGAACCVDWLVLVWDQAGSAATRIAAIATPLRSFFILRPLRVDASS